MHRWLQQGMAGCHDEVKVSALVQAMMEDNVGNGGVGKGDVVRLCQAASLSEGTVFLPWEWGSEATEALRDQGCTLRMSKDKGSFNPVRKASFEEAKGAGVYMDCISFAVEDAVTDVMLPIALSLIHI